MFQFRLFCGAQGSSSQDIMEQKQLGELCSAALHLGGLAESSLGYSQYSAAAELGDRPFAQCGNLLLLIFISKK